MNSARTVMVQGTASHVGKSVITTALCRALARRGLRVAPFKAQNMSLNSAVAADGGEMGRSQAFQAAACGIEPETAMNPVLLKPMGGGRCQVIVRGKPLYVAHGHGTAEQTVRALAIAAEALDELRRRFDVVVLEGMGSPAEINLRDRDGANMPVAALAEAPVLLVGDIERGGVFASLAGTMELLPPADRARVAGFLINKYHGEPDVLRPGIEELQRRYGVRTLGVLPWLRDLQIEEEDAVSLSRSPVPAGSAEVEVVVPRLPAISNFTDLAPLEREPGVTVRYLSSVVEWGTPDLVVLPGSRSVAADLQWLRARGLVERLSAYARGGGRIVGLCGGYQMLGRRIHDPHGIEGGGSTAGLGLLDVETTLEETKLLDQVRGECLLPGLEGICVTGYEIHHGETQRSAGTSAAVRISVARHGSSVPRLDGACDETGRVVGSYLHGLFDEPDFRRGLLRMLGWRGGAAAALEKCVFDRLADWLEAGCDFPAILQLMSGSSGSMS